MRRGQSPITSSNLLISPHELKAALSDGGEIALLDVRETGVFIRGHILQAASAPLWRMEQQLDRLVPRRSTRIVVTDADGSLLHEAAAKLGRLGWTDVSILAGGCASWVAAGYCLFTGSNVMGKAFGEVIEHEKQTPWILASDLDERIRRGDDVVVVDSRTPEEFADFSLSFAHNLPGAELVYRIGEIAPRPETLVVVNCAGRTRGIVGAQTLIDAGLPNPVASLKDGTIAWLMAGHALSRGRSAALPQPGEEARRAARLRAEAVASRAGVRRIGMQALRAFDREASTRTLYRFDVRTREEYEAGHLAGWRWAPGGQLVQATDEYVATRGARIVLADWDGVRALTTAAWLCQIGGYEVHVVAPDRDEPLVAGPERVNVLAPPTPATLVTATTLEAAINDGSAAVFDIERRAAYERGHIAGALFCVPDRIEEFLASVTLAQFVVLASSDGELAQVVAPQLAAMTGRDIRALSGGTRGWIAAGRATGTGSGGVLSGEDDFFYSPYGYADLSRRDAGFRQYIQWELGLVAQLELEGDVGFRLLPDLSVEAA
jgi:rhodanese-related sulfurtransferase